MAGISVRNGRSEDIEPAIAVYLASNDARRGGEPTPADHVERVGANVHRPDAIFLVATDETDYAGMALAMQSRTDYGAGPPEPGICFISMIFVAPDRWGEGIGRRLVEAVLAEARSQGYASAQLWTHANNSRAQRLYERTGFTLSGLRHENDLGELIVQYQRSLVDGAS